MWIDNSIVKPIEKNRSYFVLYVVDEFGTLSEKSCWYSEKRVWSVRADEIPNFDETKIKFWHSSNLHYFELLKENRCVSETPQFGKFNRRGFLISSIGTVLFKSSYPPDDTNSRCVVYKSPTTNNVELDFCFINFKTYKNSWRDMTKDEIDNIVLPILIEKATMAGYKIANFHPLVMTSYKGTREEAVYSIKDEFLYINGMGVLNLENLEWAKLK